MCRGDFDVHALKMVVLWTMEMSVLDSKNELARSKWQQTHCQVETIGRCCLFLA